MVEVLFFTKKLKRKVFIMTRSFCLIAGLVLLVLVVSAFTLGWILVLLEIAVCFYIYVRILGSPNKSKYKYITERYLCQRMQFGLPYLAALEMCAEYNKKSEDIQFGCFNSQLNLFYPVTADSWFTFNISDSNDLRQLCQELKKYTRYSFFAAFRHPFPLVPRWHIGKRYCMSLDLAHNSIEISLQDKNRDNRDRDELLLRGYLGEDEICEILTYLLNIPQASFCNWVLGAPVSLGGRSLTFNCSENEMKNPDIIRRARIKVIPIGEINCMAIKANEIFLPSESLYDKTVISYHDVRLRIWNAILRRREESRDRVHFL